MSKKIIMFYVPVGTQKQATELTESLINKRLAACVQVHEADSSYAWKGVFNREKEWILTIKTSLKKQKDCYQFLKQNHPYELPCIIWRAVEVNQEYQQWVKDQLKTLF
ncbi:MAG TPA: divalent-cation tolerance protein CutA [Saprospiraceae bacterium]|nr:divalent-cation tolerance protein CutA [Saprospiraceae bacterium]